MMERSEKTVFISYRRVNMPWALAIYKDLRDRGYDVFFDFQSINSGDFEQVILGNIRARAHFLVLLTPLALERCIDPEDWMRREIETAIGEKRNIVPLFLEGFSFINPSHSQNLTGKLAELKKYNGLNIPSDYFYESMERLHQRFLNISLDAVLHPVSRQIQEIVRQQQNAADQEDAIRAGLLIGNWRTIHENLEEIVLYDLPAKPYRELAGREQLLEEALQALGNKESKWIIGIDGMGGIGKTALACELADCCLTRHLFDYVFWLQSPKIQPPAKRKNLFVASLNRIFRSTKHMRFSVRGSLTYELIVDALAQRFGAPDAMKMKLTEKEAHIRFLLRNQRVLIVLDNLETASESQDEISRRLRQVLSPTKAVMTSRQRFSGDIYSIHLAGLDEKGTEDLVDQLADEIGGKTAQRGEVQKIQKVTGGSPLAIKHVVGQMQALPLEIVLNHLQDIRPPSRDGSENDDLRFYKGIFMPSWNLLSKESRKILVAMTHFSPNVGGTLEAIHEISDFTDEVVANCIKELWRYSFVENGRSISLKKKRYYLLPLTYHFVLTDIVKIL